ncbi:MAG: retropepsin-like aspartic protease family protein [Cognatishimia sp.]
MDQIETPHLIYLILLAIAVVAWFVSDVRQTFRKTVQQALAWVLIFLGVIAAVGMWEEIRSAAIPTQTVFADQGRIEIPVSPDGHYYLTAEVNDVDVRFVVDTGASNLVLSKRAAQSAGIDVANLRYFGRAMTANGEVRTASVKLDEVAVGSYHDRNVSARITQGDLDISLLGMSYLQLYDQITITRGKLILTR